MNGFHSQFRSYRLNAARQVRQSEARGLPWALLFAALSACVPLGPGGLGRLLPEPTFSPNALAGGLDSPSVTCRNSLSACAALYGKEIGSAAGVLQVALDATERSSVEEALEKCADLARTEVLGRYEGRFAKASPSARECLEETRDARGRKVTWAMRLGLEMHEVALRCAEERLGKLRPGKFSLEPRYRPGEPPKPTRWVSREEEQALEESGNGGELQGTLKPDVVIHSGNPLLAQAVYDFKFPCANTLSMPEWTTYPSGHRFAYKHQGEVYQKFIANIVGRIAPWIGTLHEP